LDHVKFTQLVNDLKKDYKMSEEAIRNLMGFTNEAEFLEQYKKEQKEREELASDIKQQTKQELNAVQNLSFILHDLITKYGDTIPNDFIYFRYGTQNVLMVACDKRLEKRVKTMVEALKNKQEDIKEVLAEAVDLALEKKLKK